jgi:hypothetical protein
MLERQFEEAASEAEATITGQGSLMKGAEKDKASKRASAEMESGETVSEAGGRHSQARQGVFSSAKTLQDAKEEDPRPYFQGKQPIDGWSRMPVSSTSAARLMRQSSDHHQHQIKRFEPVNAPLAGQIQRTRLK